MTFHYNGIGEIPEGTKVLRCERHITMLPVLPQGLEELDCAWAQITTLPELPESLRKLNCRGCQFISWPKLPENLQELNYYAHRGTLPLFPASLKIFNGFVMDTCIPSPESFYGIGGEYRTKISWHLSRYAHEIRKLKKDMSQIKDDLKKLKKEIEELKYAPGGIEYLRAKERFEERRKQALNET